MKAIEITLSYFLERSSVGPNGCWVWNGAKGGNGYGSMRSKGVTMAPHRAVFQLLHGRLDADTHVCHRCDNRLCCNPDHLFAGSRGDNMQDCLAKGRFKTPFGSGENGGRAKLTLEQAKAAKADPRPNKVIAAQYGVHPSAIGHIKAGRSWPGI